MATLEKHVKRGAISAKLLKEGTGGTSLPTGRRGRSEAMDAQMDYSANAGKKRDNNSKKTSDFKNLQGA